MPFVVPVNYVLDNDTIVFRTAAGQQLDSLMRFPVSFQVDAFDYVKRVGWSVLVRGSAAEVSVDDDSEVPTSWTKGHRNHWVRISGKITGRFIEPDEYTPHPAGYI